MVTIATQANQALIAFLLHALILNKEFPMDKATDKVQPIDHSRMIDLFYMLELKTLVDTLIYQHKCGITG